MSNKSSSLRLKIVLWMTLPLLVISLALTAGAALIFQQQSDSQINEALSRETSELQLLAADFDSAESLLREFVQRSSPNENEQLFAVVNSQVSIRSGVSGIRLDQDAEFMKIVNSVTTSEIGEFQNEQGTFRWIAVPVNGTNDSGVMVAAFNIQPQQQQTALALASFASLALIAVLASIIIGWFSSARIFRPIKSISNSLGSIDSQDLHTRVSVSGSGDELDKLANEFNGMLDRLQLAFENQKQFVDDAGHELRTPLTVIRGHLDLLESNPDSNSGSLEIVKDELARMSRLVSDLQTLTKSNQPDFVALEKVDLSQFNDELFVKAEALAERAWVPSETVCDENLEIDRQRITQAVLQLADNACKQTTDNDQIEVGVDCGEGYVAFFVADSGPGIAVSEREKIKKRFARGNKHSEQGEGSGLGLAVVDAIATAHGGYLRIDESKFGGAWVGIVLPRGAK